MDELLLHKPAREFLKVVANKLPKPTHVRKSTWEKLKRGELVAMRLDDLEGIVDATDYRLLERIGRTRPLPPEI